MQPRIDKTKFGSITIAGERYEHAVIIRLSGKVEKRRNWGGSTMPKKPDSRQ